MLNKTQVAKQAGVAYPTGLKYLDALSIDGKLEGLTEGEGRSVKFDPKVVEMVREMRAKAKVGRPASLLEEINGEPPKQKKARARKPSKPPAEANPVGRYELILRLHVDGIPARDLHTRDVQLGEVGELIAGAFTDTGA